MTHKSIQSQTTQLLYRTPTAAEMRPSRKAIIKANLKDFALFIGVSLVMWFVITFLLSFIVGG